MNEVLTTLVSMPFAVAVTALLRKRWPVIDGVYVYLVVAVLAIIGSLLTRYSYAVPEDVWIVLSPLLTAVLAVGGVQAAQHITQGIPASPQEFSPEAPTKKEGRL
jgi:hypothetical protein